VGALPSDPVARSAPALLVDPLVRSVLAPPPAPVSVLKVVPLPAGALAEPALWSALLQSSGVEQASPLAGGVPLPPLPRPTAVELPPVRALPSSHLLRRRQQGKAPAAPVC
jgi:hypothetical protein